MSGTARNALPAASSDIAAPLPLTSCTRVERTLVSNNGRNFGTLNQQRCVSADLSVLQVDSGQTMHRMGIGGAFRLRRIVSYLSAITRPS